MIRCHQQVHSLSLQFVHSPIVVVHEYSLGSLKLNGFGFHVQSADFIIIFNFMNFLPTSSRESLSLAVVAGHSCFKREYLVRSFLVTIGKTVEAALCSE